jgi:hypothetical protein
MGEDDERQAGERPRPESTMMQAQVEKVLFTAALYSKFIGH